MDMQPGDVLATFADTRLLTGLVGTLPHTDLDVGIRNFVDWYQGAYNQAPQ
jgi:UDP-glucuronate 4-epimerase